MRNLAFARGAFVVLMIGAVCAACPSSDTHTTYHPNGTVSSDGARLNGERRLYREDGSLMSRGRIEEGQPIGDWKLYRSDGSLCDEVDVSDGSSSGAESLGQVRRLTRRCS